MPESGSQPRKKGTPFHPSSEFKGKNGRVLYCLECRRLALEYAGCQMVFHRSGSDKLVHHLRELLKPPPHAEGPRKLFLGSRNGEEYVGLYPEQIKEAAELIEMTVLIMDAEAEEGHA